MTEKKFSESDISGIIELAWCDKTSFNMITDQTGLSENEVKVIMRQHLKPSSYRLWRRRVVGQKVKHRKKYFSTDQML